jgi:hypothetical protein
VGGSATSYGLPEATGISPQVLTSLVKASDPHIQFSDFTKRGYGVIEIGPNGADCQLKAVDAKTQGASTPTTIASFHVPLGARSPQQVS